MTPPAERLESLAGDASTRRYERLWRTDGRHAIRVSYPHDERTRLTRDLEVAAWLAARGLRLPRVQQVDLERGWALLEDFGPDDAEAVLRGTPPDQRRALVSELLKPLVQLARIPPTDLPDWSAPLDRGRLRWELAGWELWWVRHRRGAMPSEATGRWLDDLACRVAEHPRRVCHRDYHLNNLYLLPRREVGLIDAQDLLVGPDSYDLVSLLGERAMPELLSPDEVEACADEWARVTGAEPGWRDRVAATGLQRGLKVIGTFARLTAAGRGSYQRWLPSLTADVARRAAAAGAPPEVTALLID